MFVLGNFEQWMNKLDQKFVLKGWFYDKENKVPGIYILGGGGGKGGGGRSCAQAPVWGMS